MNGSDLVLEVRKNMPSLTAAEAAGAVDAVFDAIRKELLSGGNVVIRGFGRFGSKVVDAREYRNPLNGAKILKPARRRPDFDFAKSLQDEVSATPLN